MDKSTWDDLTKEELIKFLEGSMKSNLKLHTWLYQNHLKVLREYENKELNGLHLMLLKDEVKNE
jgi:hypothetical protein